METWNLKHILEGKTPDQIISELKRKVKIFGSYNKKLNKRLKASDLRKIIVLREKIDILAKKINAYYGLKLTEDTSDSNMLSKVSHLNQFSTELENEMLFFDVWFTHLDNKTAKRLMGSKEVKDYHYYLYQLRKAKPFTKSEEVEKIISLKSITGRGAFSNLYEVFTNQFKYEFNGRKNQSQEDVLSYVHSSNPKLREDAYRTVLGKYEKESVLISEIYKNIVLDWNNEGVKIRGHKSPISIRNYYNDIEDEYVSTLIKVIRKNSKVFREYFKLKYDFMKKKGKNYKFSRYHLYAPYEANGKKYGYAESKKIVLETYKKFDERFYKAAKEIFDRKHVHSHPKANKRSGAFCYGIYNKETPYILLNHTDTLRDVFTMMHEFGHGIHDVFARKQVDLLFNVPLPMAETASVFGEMMLASQMLEKASKEEKINLLLYLLDNQYATIIRQTYFVLFEMLAHDNIKEGISKEELDKQYSKLLKEQFGTMEVPEFFHHEWNYIPHIHATPFYCYAYSWGNLMVLAFYAMYKEQGKKFIDKYIELLSAGGSDSPAKLLKKMGVDPKSEEFWQKGFDIIKKEIKELKTLL